MKTAKKVLSIILAVMMAFSVCAIAVSAYGDSDTATHHSSMTLTAKIGGTSSAYTTYTSASPIHVKAGDTIYVYVNASTDYPTAGINTQVFYSAALLDPSGLAGVSGTEYRTTANKNVKWNSTGNDFLKESELSGRQFTYWNNMVESGHNTGWPADTSEVNKENWKFNIFFANSSAALIQAMQEEDESYEACAINGSQRLLYFPMYVPASAKGGDTYQIKVPETSIRSATNKSGPFFASEYPGGDVTAMTVMYFGEDQYTDLSMATLNFVVDGDVELSYDALQAKYDEVKNTVVSNYTDPSAFNTALSAAATMLADKDAADQDAIDTLVTNLDNAFKALDLKGASYTALDAAIASKGTTYVESNYTPDTWLTFANAVTAGQNVSRALKITDQATVDNATKAITDAAAALRYLGANYAALNSAIELAGTKTASWYTTNSWSAMQTALTNANNVDKTLDKTQQGIVDAAAEALNQAITDLVEADASYVALEAAKSLAATKNKDDYTPQTWNNLETALEAANKVATGLKAKDQGTIDTATDNLNQAITNLAPIGKANYSELQAVVNAGTTYTQDKYAADAYATYKTTLDAANKMISDDNLKATEQALVDQMKADLIAAKAELDTHLIGADYTAVDAALAKIPTDLSLYTPTTVAALTTARNNVTRGYDFTRQSDVDKMAADVEDAVSKLAFKAADTAALIAAITAADAVNTAVYTPETVAPFNEALQAAKDLRDKSPLDIRDQADINAATLALNNAKNNLEAQGADYSELTDAIADYESRTSSWYTTISWLTATTAYNDAKAIADGEALLVTEQGRIDTAAGALADALTNLVEADADYSEVTAATNNTTGLKSTNYTPATWQALQDALGAVETGLKAKDQARVDKFAEDINTARTNLEYASIDYTETEEQVTIWGQKTEGDYTPDSWAAAKALFDDITYGYKMDNYSKYMLQLSRLKTALKNLEPAAAADYSAVTAAQGEAAKLTASDYTPESWQDLQDALNAVVTGYNENRQADVTAMATAITNAIANLDRAIVEEDANYTNLDKALADAQALTASQYTDATWATLTRAVNAGKAVARDLKASQQGTVDSATKAITDAIANLEKYASYAALDAAIADAATYDQNNYTEETWADLASALSTANGLSRLLGEKQQGTIDNATKAITDAIAGLHAKATTSAVTAVTYTPSASQVNDFAVKVVGRAEKVRFIDPNGNTWTYNRYHDKVSIVSYNDAGEVVNSLDRGLAYEIWTINVNMPVNKEMKACAKFEGAFEELSYKFNVSLLAPELDTTVYSKELAVITGPKGKVVATVVTGLDVQAVRFITAKGETCTYAASTATQQDGKLVFTGNTYNNALGENITTVKIRVQGVWQDAGTLSYVAE